MVRVSGLGGFYPSYCDASGISGRAKGNPGLTSLGPVMGISGAQHTEAPY